MWAVPLENLVQAVSHSVAGRSKPERPWPLVAIAEAEGDPSLRW